MDRVDWRRNGRHFGEWRGLVACEHRAAERTSVHFLGRERRSCMLKAVLDRRNGRELALTSITLAGEQAVDLVEDVTRFGVRARRLFDLVSLSVLAFRVHMASIPSWSRS
jgi:hypothetical protein